MLPPKPPRFTPTTSDEMLLYIELLQRYNELLDEYMNLLDFRPGKKGDVGFGKIPESKVDMKMATEDLEIVDAGTVGATLQSWLEVKINGVQGFIQVSPTK